MRRAAKIDATQTAIVAALRQAGCRVLSLAAVGNGVADLLVKTPHRMEANALRWSALFLLEVKNPAGRGTELTPDQVKFHEDWPVTVVTTPADALAAVRLTGGPEA